MELPSQEKEGSCLLGAKAPGIGNIGNSTRNSHRRHYESLSLVNWELKEPGMVLLTSG